MAGLASTRLRAPPGSAACRRRDRPRYGTPRRRQWPMRQHRAAPPGLPGEDLLRQAKPARPRTSRTPADFSPLVHTPAAPARTGRARLPETGTRPVTGMHPAPGPPSPGIPPMPPAWSSAGGEQAGRLTLSRTGDQTIIVGSTLPPGVPPHRYRRHTGPLSAERQMRTAQRCPAGGIRAWSARRRASGSVLDVNRNR